MAADPSVLVGATFEAVPPKGSPVAVSDSPLTVFPRDGSEFAILSTGDATEASGPSLASANNGGGHVRGLGDYDVTILRVDLDPGQANCLRLDFQFLTTEAQYPYDDFGGDLDAFVAELNTSSWGTSGEGSLWAPDDFAVYPHRFGSNYIRGKLTEVPITAYTTGYRYASALFRSSVALPAGDNNGALPGRDSLYLSIFDMKYFIAGDDDSVNWLNDSAVLIDRFVVERVGDPGRDCTGTQALLKPTLVLFISCEEGEIADFVAKLSDGRGTTTDRDRCGAYGGPGVPDRDIVFRAYLPGLADPVLVCTGRTDGGGKARCDSEQALRILMRRSWRAEAEFKGDDSYLASKYSLSDVFGERTPD